MNEIAVVRGDTLTLTDIKLSDGTEYVLSDSDIVYLEVKNMRLIKQLSFVNLYNTGKYYICDMINDVFSEGGIII